MKDSQIVNLFINRNESALLEISQKYERYCHSISYNILGNHEDAKECVNDTYMAAWKSIPPHKPEMLSTYLGKLARRISLNKWRNATAQKRGGGEITLVLEELQDVIRDENNVENIMERKMLTQAINEWLKNLPVTERDVFVCRYWYFASIEEISEKFSYSESKTKSMLFRSRKKLYDYLEKEGLL